MLSASKTKLSIFLSADKESLVRVSNEKLPAAALALSTSRVWEVIRSQKDLNLPAHRVIYNPVQI